MNCSDSVNNTFIIFVSSQIQNFRFKDDSIRVTKCLLYQDGTIMKTYRKTFGSRLVDLREQRNLLGKDVAANLHLSSQAYSQYENDRRRPDLETALRLAHFYDVSLEYLIAGEGVYEKGIAPHLDESVTDLPPEAINELLLFYDYLRYKYKADGIYASHD